MNGGWLPLAFASLIPAALAVTEWTYLWSGLVAGHPLLP